MTKAKKTQSDKTNQADSQNYRATGLVFLIAGFAMVIPEVTRATGIPFLILGVTFFAISQSESPAKRNK